MRFVQFLLFVLFDATTLVFEQNIFNEWITEDIGIGSKPFLFQLAPRGEALQVACESIPWFTCRDTFHLRDTILIRVRGEHVNTIGVASVASVAADLFGIPEMVSRYAFNLWLDETAKLHVEYTDRDFHQLRHVEWIVSLDIWYLGDTVFYSGPTVFDITTMGISIPYIFFEEIMEDQFIIKNDSEVWARSDLPPLRLARTNGEEPIVFPWELLSTNESFDGFCKTLISVRNGLHAGTAIYIGPLLLQTVSSVRFDTPPFVELGPSSQPISLNPTLLHLPVFHSPVVHTNWWGDSFLRLYPARVPLPRGARPIYPEGVVVPLTVSDSLFRYIGPSNSDSVSIPIPGFRPSTSEWSKIITLSDSFSGECYFEKKIASDDQFLNDLVFTLEKGFLVSELLARCWDSAVPTDDACSICLAVYTDEPDVAVVSLLNCEHCFHSECIREWIKKGKNGCPLCRTKIHRVDKIKSSVIYKRIKAFLRIPEVNSGLLMAYVAVIALPSVMIQEQVLLHTCIVCFIMLYQVDKFMGSIIQWNVKSLANKSNTFENLSPRTIQQINIWRGNT